MLHALKSFGRYFSKKYPFQQGLYVLGYHEVSPVVRSYLKGMSLTVSQENFRQHIEFVRKKYRFMAPEELTSFLKSTGLWLPKN